MGFKSRLFSYWCHLLLVFFSIVWFSIHFPQYIITETLATFQSGSIHLDTSHYEEASVILHGKEHNPWTGPPEPGGAAARVRPLPPTFQTVCLPSLHLPHFIEKPHFPPFPPPPLLKSYWRHRHWLQAYNLDHTYTWV